MKIKNGPTVTYTLIYALLPKAIHTLKEDGYYHEAGKKRGHLVMSEGFGGVMYHKVEEMMIFKCEARK